MALALQEEAAAPAGAGAGTVAVVNPVAAAIAAVAAAQTQARPAVTFVTTVPPRYLLPHPKAPCIAIAPAPHVVTGDAHRARWQKKSRSDSKS